MTGHAELQRRRRGVVGDGCAQGPHNATAGEHTKPQKIQRNWRHNGRNREKSAAHLCARDVLGMREPEAPAVSPPAERRIVAPPSCPTRPGHKDQRMISFGQSVDCTLL